MYWDSFWANKFTEGFRCAIVSKQLTKVHKQQRIKSKQMKVQLRLMKINADYERKTQKYRTFFAEWGLSRGM